MLRCTISVFCLIFLDDREFASYPKHVPVCFPRNTRCSFSHYCASLWLCTPLPKRDGWGRPQSGVAEAQGGRKNSRKCNRREGVGKAGQARKGPSVLSWGQRKTQNGFEVEEGHRKTFLGEVRWL